MEESVRAAIKGKPLTFQRIGSMFCLYFTEGPVRNLAAAKKSDTTAFARHFHASLREGIYFAPSQFEAGFISTSHTGEALDHVSRVLRMLLGVF
jgi:glutamate-1-semialdehyde 2,1-aminomutase